MKESELKPDIQTPEAFVGYLTIMMKIRGVTRAELARRLGVSRPTVTQMFQRGNLELKNLIKIANILNLRLLLLSPREEDISTWE